MGDHHDGATLLGSQFLEHRVVVNLRSLIVDEPRNATCIAASDRVDVFALDKVNFKNSLETSASFKNQIEAIYFQRQ